MELNVNLLHSSYLPHSLTSARLTYGVWACCSMLFFVASCLSMTRISLPSTERFRWASSTHFILVSVHLGDWWFLLRLEFMRNLLGWAGDPWNCCMLCFRLVVVHLEKPSFVKSKIFYGFPYPEKIFGPLYKELLIIQQTDPKQRITVRQLLTHPWMMEGYETPVKWQTRWVN